MLNAKLNTDVFAVVSEFLTDYSDVLSFSLVCSTLHRIAIRRLLSMGPVSLKGDLSVQKFHTFLFAGAVVRAPGLHVRALHIEGSKLPPRIANKTEDSSPLVDIINSCPKLEHIAICLGKGSTYDERSVVVAIAALRTLRSLEVSGWSENTLSLLYNVSSPLRKLAIYSCYFRSPDVLDEFLPRLAPSLEDLEVIYFSVHEDTLVALDDNAPRHDGHPPPFRTLSQYPAVRSFSAIRLMGAPLLDRLQHLFPALDGTLSLGVLEKTIICTCSEDAIRAANRRTQDDAPERAWKKLDRVVCDAPMLYALALRCPVRLVMIDWGSAQTLHYAAEALRQNPVPRLKLTLEYGRGMFTGVFIPELARTLSHLTLCLVYGNKNRRTTGGDAGDFGKLRWDSLLRTLLTELRPLHNLTYLRILICCKLHKPGDPIRQKAAYSEKFVDAVRGPAFDFAGTAAALVRAVPSLQYVFLTTCGRFVERVEGGEGAQTWRSYDRWDVSRAWRVAVRDAKRPRRLVRLHSDVADTIIRNEELVLSETDKCSLFPKED